MPWYILQPYSFIYVNYAFKHIRLICRCLSGVGDCIVDLFMHIWVYLITTVMHNEQVLVHSVVRSI